MHLSASRKSNRLPKRFPVGTTYVVEGRGGEHGDLRVFSRYVVLPGGQRINLTEDFTGSSRVPRSSRARRRRASGRTGTPGSRVKTAASRERKLSPNPEPAARAAVRTKAPGEAPQPLTLNHPASNPGRFSGRGSSFSGDRAHRLFPADNQIVAMDHLGPARKAEDCVDIGG